jgi:SAM-dependent methyltransferase
VTPEQAETWALAYLRHAPLSLCLRELNRLLGMVAVEEELGVPAGPVLDVGCGDGFWWTQRDAAGREIYGIDISASEIAQAKKHIRAEVADVSEGVPSFARSDQTVGAHETLSGGSGSAVAGRRFGQIIGNCSLEHVREIDAALRSLRAVAEDDGRLVLFVPAAQWAYQGRLQSALLARAPRLAMAFAGALNGFFQHWHLYELPVWKQILAQNGWRVTWSRGLGSERTEFLFRLFLPPAFASFLAKQVTGRYPSRLLRHVPDAWLRPLARAVARAVTDPLVDADSPHAYEYVLVAHPIPVAK